MCIFLHLTVTVFFIFFIHYSDSKRKFQPHHTQDRSRESSHRHQPPIVGIYALSLSRDLSFSCEMHISLFVKNFYISPTRPFLRNRCIYLMIWNYWHHVYLVLNMVTQKQWEPDLFKTMYTFCENLGSLRRYFRTMMTEPLHPYKWMLEDIVSL